MIIACNKLLEKALPKYTNIHQTRGNGKTGGGVEMIIYKSFTYKIRPDLRPTMTILKISTNCKYSKNIFINTHYRQPARKYSEFNKHFKDL